MNPSLTSAELLRSRPGGEDVTVEVSLQVTVVFTSKASTCRTRETSRTRRPWGPWRSLRTGDSASKAVEFDGGI